VVFQGRARAVLTAVLALLGYYGVVLALAFPVQLLVPAAWFRDVVGVGLASLPLVGAATLAHWILVRRGWTSWRTLGWDVGRGASGVGASGTDWALGIRVLALATLGGIALALVALLLVLVGGGGLAATGEAVSRYATRAALVSAVLLVAALSEELLFRGYPLARLSKAIGRIGASVALAVVFALIHLANPEVSLSGLANIGLASLVMSAAFFTRGGLWAAWGVHFGWNAGLALFADAPVSGYRFDLPVLEYAAGSRDWLTGGTFGPEGGLAATAALALGLGALIVIIRRDEERRNA
jgi:membrane protease YdiL (CAAX protease family)